MAPQPDPEEKEVTSPTEADDGQEDGSSSGFSVDMEGSIPETEDNENVSQRNQEEDFDMLESMGFDPALIIDAMDALPGASFETLLEFIENNDENMIPEDKLRQLVGSTDSEQEDDDIDESIWEQLMMETFQSKKFYRQCLAENHFNGIVEALVQDLTGERPQLTYDPLTEKAPRHVLEKLGIASPKNENRTDSSNVIWGLEDPKVIQPPRQSGSATIKEVLDLHLKCFEYEDLTICQGKDGDLRLCPPWIDSAVAERFKQVLGSKTAKSWIQYIQLKDKRSYEVKDFREFATHQYQAFLQQAIEEIIYSLPIIGEVHGDDSLTLEPLSEWELEWYRSKVVRPDVLMQKLQNIPVASHFGTADEKLLHVHEGKLNQDGQDRYKSILEEIEKLESRGLFSSKIAQTSATVKERSDRICWIKIGSENPTISALVHFMAMTASQLFWKKGQLLQPEKAMVAIYDDTGAYYGRHRDNEYDTVEKKWMNYRGVTCICYLSEQPFGEDSGGQLRAYSPDDTLEPHHVDIIPQLGTFLWFDSKIIEHEVLATHQKRKAITVWLMEMSK